MPLATNTIVISTRALTKRYRAVLAVDADVRRGEIYGFLGRNGAGRTTTIRMLLGLIRPTAGDFSVFGRRIVPGEASVFRRVGFLVEVRVAEGPERAERLLRADAKSTLPKCTCHSVGHIPCHMLC